MTKKWNALYDKRLKSQRQFGATIWKLVGNRWFGINGLPCIQVIIKGLKTLGMG